MNTRTSKTSSNKNNSAKSNAKNTSTPSSPKSTKSSSPRMHPKKIDDVNKLQATPRKQARSSRDQSPVKRLDKSSTEQVYAGPTFNNAPVPSALPIPSFSPRGSPINQPQPLYMSSTPSLQHQSAYLMNLLIPQQKPVYSYELEQRQSISEIQNGLRSMLKIAC